MRRADTQAPSTPISTWFSPIATSRPSPSSAAPIRVTSDNARAGTIACAVAGGARQVRCLDGQPVAVGGGHGHRAVAELDQDAGQHRARLVLGRRAADVGDRLGERGAIDGEALAAGQRDLREVVGALGVQRVLAGAARQAQRSAAGGLLERRRPRAAARARSRPAGGRGRRCGPPPRPARPAAAPAPRAPCRSRRARRPPRRRRSGSPRGSGRWIAATRREPRSAASRAAHPAGRRSSSAGAPGGRRLTVHCHCFSSLLKREVIGVGAGESVENRRETVAEAESAV